MQSPINYPQSTVSNQQSFIQFSQGSLQDYVDCRCRFQLRYLLKVAWPALEAEPVLEHEAAMQRGALFHRLIQQHLLGIPVDQLTPLAQENDLNRWWQNYLGIQFPPAVALFPEVTLSMPLLDYRLVAKYDLILVRSGDRINIYDWKTTRRRPKRAWLLERLQSRVYPYLLTQAGAHLTQVRPILPEQVEMIYWFSEAPNEPEIISYTTEQYTRDEVYLKSLIGEIKRLEDGDFNLTERIENCRFCTYRSLCDRGVEAGDLNEIEIDSEPTPEVEFNFDQIAEITF